MVKNISLAIRFALHGCTNRPFYHIVVMPKYKARNSSIIEQVGTFDPMANKNNEKAVGLNFERLSYWIASGAVPNQSVEKLLGLCGFYPIHPMTYIKAKRNRKAAAAKAESEGTENAEESVTS